MKTITMKNGDKPAFTKSIIETGSVSFTQDLFGLTKREYFAVMSMQALLANPELFKIASEQKHEVSINIYSKAAIEHADDLLAQLEK